MTLSEENRIRWRDELDASHPTLARELRELLKEHEAEREGFLQRRMDLPLPSLGLAGQTLGAYRLIRPIGHGGMERFKREGAILGRLSHPNIAELLDASVTSTGQPFLVLEYVEGDPIDRYCDEQKLEVQGRIRLFLDVLGAVAHAHANLIVHRDIKPSNVEVSKDGQVKLLDFGIAKLMEGEGETGAATLLTREAGSALTREYAAPEQVTGRPVTPATDVYALGVLLYLLLTGQHPLGPGPHSPAILLKAVTLDEKAIESSGAGAVYLPILLIRRSSVRLAAQQPDQAAADASRALVLLQATLEAGAVSSNVGHAFLAQGRALQAQGKTSEAGAAFRSTAEHLEPTLGPDHPDTRAARQLAGIEVPHG